MNPYQPNGSCCDLIAVCKTRKVIGWLFFAATAPAVLVTLTLAGMCHVLVAIWEATMCKIMDDEAWISSYNRTRDERLT